MPLSKTCCAMVRLTGTGRAAAGVRSQPKTETISVGVAPVKRIALTPRTQRIMTGGDDRAMPRENASTPAREMPAVKPAAIGSVVTGKFERKSASRVALAATCCATSSPAARQAKPTEASTDAAASGPDPVATAGPAMRHTRGDSGAVPGRLSIPARRARIGPEWVRIRRWRRCNRSRPAAASPAAVPRA